VLGRALCSLGEWDDALSEIESVKDEVPPFQVGMAIAPLVVIALARGEDERVRELVAEHDRRCSDAGASVFESDFRSLRAMVLDPESDRDGRTPPAEIITGAQVADYAEWAGWLGPVVDRVLADPGREQLVVALEALRGPGAMKRFPPVLAQAAQVAQVLPAAAPPSLPAFLTAPVAPAVAPVAPAAAPEVFPDGKVPSVLETMEAAVKAMMAHK
jgi:hypothetical protein